MRDAAASQAAPARGRSSMGALPPVPLLAAAAARRHTAHPRSCHRHPSAHSATHQRVPLVQAQTQRQVLGGTRHGGAPPALRPLEPPGRLQLRAGCTRRVQSCSRVRSGIPLPADSWAHPVGCRRMGDGASRQRPGPAAERQLAAAHQNPAPPRTVIVLPGARHVRLCHARALQFGRAQPVLAAAAAALARAPGQGAAVGVGCQVQAIDAEGVPVWRASERRGCREGAVVAGPVPRAASPVGDSAGCRARRHHSRAAAPALAAGRRHNAPRATAPLTGAGGGTARWCRSWGSSPCEQAGGNVACGLWGLQAPIAPHDQSGSHATAALPAQNEHLRQGLAARSEQEQPRQKPALLAAPHRPG